LVRPLRNYFGRSQLRLSKSLVCLNTRSTVNQESLSRRQSCIVLPRERQTDSQLAIRDQREQ
jgi:hypothetical protein